MKETRDRGRNNWKNKYKKKKKPRKRGSLPDLADMKNVGNSSSLNGRAVSKAYDKSYDLRRNDMSSRRRFLNIILVVSDCCLLGIQVRNVALLPSCTYKFNLIKVQKCLFC